MYNTEKEFSSEAYLDMELLRFTTAGSVDDGKSTLIGRLLFDSKSIFEDQLEAMERASMQKGDEHMNLALLTDGLRAEREQGITIDVAYRYFATPKRKFIIADTPGHVQYTRNMVTGASTANAAIILIDARNGVIEQTYRHTYIASLLQIPHVIVCINKMDLVDYDEATYEKIKADFEAFASKLDVHDARFVPISALHGDNVVNRSENMPWYEGSSLIHVLENIHIGSDFNHVDPRLPVQYVIRPQSDKFHDFRGYAGRIFGGVFQKGDEVKVLPSGHTSTVKEVYGPMEPVEEVFAPMAATLTLTDDIDISRGDMIVRADNQPRMEKEFDVMMNWMHPEPMQLRGKYTLMHSTNEAMVMPVEVKHKVDVSTLERKEDDKVIGLNDIARVTLKASKPITFDPYRKNRLTGSIILVDGNTNETVGVGMII